MNDMFTVEHDCSDRKRAQFRLVAEIIGIDEAYLVRMLVFFGARVCCDRQLGRFCTQDPGRDRARHMDRMMAFWRMIALYEDGYVGDLVAAHRNLPDIRREDFERWLELFRATLVETAPTPEAANYLMARATHVAQRLEMELFGRGADEVSVPRKKITAYERS